MKFLRKLQDRFESKRNVRRLELSKTGKWYLVLTIGLGVVALASGNNVIYFIESLLLGGLILSGVLSEQTISAIRVDFLRVQARAEEPARDWIVLTNRSRIPLFCVEIGEWKDGEFSALAFVAKIEAKETVRVKSEQVIPSRGVYRWDGFAIATSIPFGFARKTKVVKIPGERVVWPSSQHGKNEAAPRLDATFGRRSSESDVVEGEVRPYDMADDARMIVAKQSVRGLGPMVRNRRPNFQEPEILLDVRQAPGPIFEKLIRDTAAFFYRTDRGELILIQKQGRKKYTGSKHALNTLALVQAEGLEAKSA